MIVLDRNILDDAEALDVSWDLAQKNINVGLKQLDTLRQTYVSDKSNLRRLANRSLAIEYGRSETIALLDEIQRTVVAMHQALCDYEIADRKIERGWAQVFKVVGAQDVE